MHAHIDQILKTIEREYFKSFYHEPNVSYQLEIASWRLVMNDCVQPFFPVVFAIGDVSTRRVQPMVGKCKEFHVFDAIVSTATFCNSKIHRSDSVSLEMANIKSSAYAVQRFIRNHVDLIWEKFIELKDSSIFRIQLNPASKMRNAVRFASVLCSSQIWLSFHSNQRRPSPVFTNVISFLYSLNRFLRIKVKLKTEASSDIVHHKKVPARSEVQIHSVEQNVTCKRYRHFYVIAKSGRWCARLHTRKIK